MGVPMMAFITFWVTLGGGGRIRACIGLGGHGLAVPCWWYCAGGAMFVVPCQGAGSRLEGREACAVPKGLMSRCVVW